MYTGRAAAAASVVFVNENDNVNGCELNYFANENWIRIKECP